LNPGYKTDLLTNLVTNLKQHGKNKKRFFEISEMEFSTVPGVEPLITVKSSETQNVDLVDKVGTNHYLRHFDHRSGLHPMNRTGSFRYMSDETSEGTHLQK
jgi:hypothetical protein